ncbi:MAG: hypothetical protein ORN85_05965 [Sediminibacterium sp.]|nr:hypothetical protein [Sediminibacterium sp.]
MKKNGLIFIFILCINFINAQQWSKEQAWQWYNNQPYLIGCNYTPAYACNEIEFWQQESFDTNAIEKELALCQKWGINTLRVYLHFLIWLNDSTYKKRIHSFLNLTTKHNIKPMFVFWDDCWNNKAIWGKQPPPKPCTHNSQWLECPGNGLKDSLKFFPILLEYVSDIINYFKNDTRILMWDLYNEVGCQGKEYKSISNEKAGSLELLKATYLLARKIRPIQPLTACFAPVSKNMNEEFYQWQTKECDVFTFHVYENYKGTFKFVEDCKKRANGRPMICTEYLARKYGSTFSEILPLFKENNIGALNWGCVAGKTNTKYPWENNTCDPQPWFHEIFTESYQPYKQSEVNLIKLMAQLPNYNTLKLLPLIPTADENNAVNWYYTNKNLPQDFISSYFTKNTSFNLQKKLNLDTQNIFSLGKNVIGFIDTAIKKYYPNLKINTLWDTNKREIYLMKQIPVTKVTLLKKGNFYLRLIFNKNVQVFINGTEVFNSIDFPDRINNYIYFPVSKDIFNHLKDGDFITVSAKGNSDNSNSWIDVGLYVTY